MKKIGFIMLMSVLLTACNVKYTSNGEKKYLQSKNGPNLIVPPPLTDENISHFYDLPQQTEDAQVNIEPSA